jgi:uncharacterized protein YegJ (DUF2314 family)
MERSEIDQFAITNRSIQFLFFGDGTDVSNKQAAISKFISAVTDGKRVAIYDFSSGQAYNHDAWKQVLTESFQSSPININDHIVFHVYRESEYCRMVSLGMCKFGLPELSVTNFPCYNQEEFTRIMNGLAQTLFENPQIYSDSSVSLDIKKIKNAAVRSMLDSDGKTEGHADLRLRKVMPQPGDGPFLQFEVIFTNKTYASPQEEQMAVLRDLLELVPEQVETTVHDEELLKASQLAKQRLPELKKMFNDGLQPGVSIIVKTPFKLEDREGNEWMWVEVTKWTDSGMEGILQNEPENIKGLSMGAVVAIKEIEIFDYILMKADGSMEGNETGKVLERRADNH